MRPEEYFEEQLARLGASGLFRDPQDASQRDELVRCFGASLLDASSNDYLGLAEAGVSRETPPLGSGASRLIHGTRSEHLTLEKALAAWVDLPAALLFSSGYSANVGLLGALGSDQTLIVSDRLNHASIIDGCRLSRARVQIAPHCELASIEHYLASSSEPVRWVVTESYFSMDGTSPDLKTLRTICDRFEAGLIVDEAHALGVFGPAGAGLCRQAGIHPDLLVGTLGKAVGAQGAFVAGSARARSWLWNRARSFVFSTAVSPLLASRVLFSVEQARAQDAARGTLRRHADHLRQRLTSAGVALIPNSHGPVVSVLLGAEQEALRAAAELRTRGILCQAIRPPTVPPGTSRLRLTLKSTLTPDEVDRLAEAVVTTLAARTTASSG